MILMLHSRVERDTIQMLRFRGGKDMTQMHRRRDDRDMIQMLRRRENVPQRTVMAIYRRRGNREGLLPAQTRISRCHVIMVATGRIRTCRRRASEREERWGRR